MTTSLDRYALAHWVDDLIEHVTRDRYSLERALAHLLPLVADRIGAHAIALTTFDETLALRTFTHPAGAESWPEMREGHPARVAHALDVAGEDFGLAVATCAPSTDPATLASALAVVCEELDNYLYAIRAARQKQRITQALVRSLQHRVLSQGLRDGVHLLAEHVQFSRLAIAIGSPETLHAPVHALVVVGGACALDTLGGTERSGVEDEARAYLEQGDRAFLDRFGFGGAQEEVLIHGVKETTVVGKIGVEPKNGSFDTYDRDLVASFGAFVCQRVVDFNKEYRTLARSFRAHDVDRMLRASDYVDRYLTPREREVAMLYADISGFTRISERILVDPARIGRLVDVWGGEVVRLLHAHGGVFDKMVGDCVIGLFGPPFYEDEPSERLQRTLQAAFAIREMTRSLPAQPEFAVLAAEGLAVSIGVNLAPLFVGMFGPNDNFTGFSAGMNNTARLQGLAARNEILVMDAAVQRLAGSPRFAFGELREAKVKNVAEPLRYRTAEPNDGAEVGSARPRR